MRKTVSHDKPKDRALASRDIAKECVMNVLQYMKKRGFSTKIPLFCVIFLAEFWGPLPPKQKFVCKTKLAALGVTICIWKNSDTFEIIQKIGSHLEKSGQF